LDKNTILILTSDNGPWTSYGNHAGSSPFREAKGTSFDGGIRSACIIKYPPAIKANSSSGNTFCSIDLLPTLCNISGVDLPENEIDGKNVWDLITGLPGAENPHSYYAITTGSNLESVMSGDGRWKLHLPHAYRTLVRAGNDGMAGIYRQDSVQLSLYDMIADPFETTDVFTQNPEIAEELLEYSKLHRDLFFSE